MKPTLGRIVHYKLSRKNVQDINRRRNDAVDSRLMDSRSGAITHFGDYVQEGDILPAIITTAVRDIASPDSKTLINIKVFLNGSDDLWVTNPAEGNDPGQWFWPPRD